MTVSPADLTRLQQRRAEEPSAVAVVIPAFRAAGSVGGVIESIPDLVGRIIVVDDACPEGSGAAAAATGDARVEVLRHARNEGVGGAVLTGLRTALIEGAAIVVKVDADGQMDPAEIPRLIAPLLTGEADYAKGNRWRDSPRLRLMPFRRRLGNLGLSLLAKAVTGYWNVFDFTNGFTAIRRDAALMLDPPRIHRRFFFEISLLIQLNCLGAVVRDVPIPARYAGETSSLRLHRVLLAFPLDLLRGLARRIWLKHFARGLSPLAVYLTSGLLLLSSGSALGAYQGYRSVAHEAALSAGAVAIAALALVLGFQLVLQAIRLDVRSVPRAPISRRLRTRESDEGPPRAAPRDLG